MIKLNRKQEIYIQIVIIIIFMIMTIPLANNESVINLISPNINPQASSTIRVFFMLFAIYSFIKLRKNLKQINSNWRYLLYIIITIWFLSNIRLLIGENIMTFRHGLQAIELQFDKSEINYRKDTLGIVQAEGHITFRNYSSDTIAFKGILHGNNFLLDFADSIGDIVIPNNRFSDKQIKIPPKSIYSYPVKFNTELEINTFKYSNYNGTINKIRKFTIYSDNERTIFNY